MGDIQEILIDLSGLLSEEDVNIIKDFMEHNETGLAASQIVDRLYDLDVKIDRNLADKIGQMCRSQGLDDSDWNFIYELTEDKADQRAMEIASSLEPNDLSFLGRATSPTEFVKMSRDRRIPDLIILRGLRERFDLSFDDAVAELNR